jgi:hypothetical protein
MNGTGHLVEDLSAPAHLCAVCLRKLQFRMGFDVPQRYQRLLGGSRREDSARRRAGWRGGWPTSHLQFLFRLLGTQVLCRFMVDI